MLSFTLAENPSRRPSERFQLQLKDFFPERGEYEGVFKYTAYHCKMIFLLKSHQTLVRELAATTQWGKKKNKHQHEYTI